METVQCKAGHQWQTDGQETVAVCPVCGAMPIFAPSVPSSQDQNATLGEAPEEPKPAGEPTLGPEVGAASRVAPEHPEVHSPARLAAPTASEPGETIRKDEHMDELAVECSVDFQLDAPAPKKDEPDPTIGVAGEDGEEDDKPGEATMAPPGEGTGTGDEAKNDRTMAFAGDERDPTYRPGAKGQTRQGLDVNDKTGAWDEGEGPPAERGKTAAVVAEQTIGAENIPSTHLETVSTEPPKKKERKKKDPLAGKKAVAGYEILGELGRGGMGVVYKARQPGANRVVALKMVLASGHAGQEALARFKIEAEAVAQLQHPNIVQLYEVGEEDGCPFFSLEFIEGEHLGKKTEGAPQPPQEAAHMIQRLADAMDVAHQRGIIHRDLKPANILLTKDGVPKITDFGLAKRFDKDEGQTRTGAIMGTPSYMAPEQAHGRTKETGPAADIYSLGAILYDLLTGRPPFRGTTVLETLQQVQSLEPIPPVRLQPSLPADLQTICLKALEKDPAKRYQTAGALAEDLRRFQAGEPILARPTPWYERTWKWVKRNPTRAGLVGVSILAVVGILTFGGLYLDSKRQAAEDQALKQKELAEAAEIREKQKEEIAHLAQKREQEQRERAKQETELKKRAEKNFQRAKDAVDEMLTRVGQEDLAYIPQMEKVRRELLNKALVFYQAFVQEKSSDTNIRYETARAQQRVADIMEMLADHRPAEKAYAAARGLYQGLVKEFPDRSDFQRDLAALASNYGNLLKDLKRNQEAEKIYREALRMRLDLSAKLKESPDFALELAKSHNNLGTILHVVGKTKEAEPEFQNGRKILSDLAKKSPGGPQYGVELARTLNNLGTLQKKTGQTAAAEKNYAQANKLLQDLASQNNEDPQYPQYRRDLALNHNLLGELLRDSNPKKAAQHYQEALKLRSQLADDFKFVPAYRQELANSYSGLAVLWQAAGKQKDADEAYDQALKIQEKLAADYGHLPEFRRFLASSYNNRGLMLVQAGRLAEGEKALARALELFNKLAKDFTDVPDYQMEVAGIYLNFGTVWYSLGRAKDAEDVNRQALKIRQAIAQKYPDVPEHQDELAKTQLNLGTLLSLSGRRQEAEVPYRQAAATFDKLAKDHPGVPDYRHQYAVSNNNLGYLLRTLNQTKEAEAAWAKAIDLYTGLVQDFAEVTTYSQELGRTYYDLANYLATAKRHPEAEKALEAAISLQEKLLDKDAGNPDFRRELARSYGNLGFLKAQAGNFPIGEKYYRKGIDLLEEYEPKLAPNPAYTGELINLHKNLANFMLFQAKPAQAEISWLRVLALQEKLVQAFPKAPAFRLEAVITLNDLGNRLQQKEKFADAKTFYEKAVDFLRPLAKGPPANADMAQNLYLMQLNLATSLAGMKDHVAAAKVIQECSMDSRPKVPKDQLAAAILAKCVPLAEKDSKLPEIKAKELAKSYADRALALLKQAVAAGFKDADFLRKNEDFEALRNREEFQTIIRNIGKRAKETNKVTAPTAAARYAP